jgi:hypothetical protein
LVTSYVLKADASTESGFAASAVWMVVAGLTFALPRGIPPAAGGGRTWRELLGFEALGLLRHPVHGVVFLTAALVSVPLAAFYPFSSMHLRDLGQRDVAALMSVGQLSEIAAMYALASLLTRVRLKWILATGIGFGVIRYAFFAADSTVWVLSGVALHGLCFTLFFIPAQIYVDRNIDRRLQSRAQALLTLMVSGAGTLVGYLGCGWWREACTTAAGTRWPLFWSVLCGVMVAVLIFYVARHRIEPVPSAAQDE